MARNPRDVGTSWRTRPCASARRAIGASMLACALAGMLSAAAPSAAARPVQVPAVADDDADNMPLGTSFDSPFLTDEQAYDVAGYIVSQKRPEKANLDKDFPIRLQKPIDTPYGPYAEGFSVEQHTLGPFGPIRAKVNCKCRWAGTMVRINPRVRNSDVAGC
jgi:hypothetical protein